MMGFWTQLGVNQMAKILIISLLVIGLSSCVSDGYAIITKDGVMFTHIKSIEDCQAILDKFKIDGICVAN